MMEYNVVKLKSVPVEYYVSASSQARPDAPSYVIVAVCPTREAAEAAMRLMRL